MDKDESVEFEPTVAAKYDWAIRTQSMNKTQKWNGEK